MQVAATAGERAKGKVAVVRATERAKVQVAATAGERAKGKVDAIRARVRV